MRCDQLGMGKLNSYGLLLVSMPSAMTLHSEQFNLSWNVMGGLFSSLNLAQLSCTAGLQILLLRISLYQRRVFPL